MCKDRDLNTDENTEIEVSLNKQVRTNYTCFFNIAFIPNFLIYFLYMVLNILEIHNPHFLICVAMYTMINSRFNVINIMSIKEMPAISFSPSSGL